MQNGLLSYNFLIVENVLNSCNSLVFRRHAKAKTWQLGRFPSKQDGTSGESQKEEQCRGTRTEHFSFHGGPRTLQRSQLSSGAYKL